jgi:hypothetical protein
LPYMYEQTNKTLARSRKIRIDLKISCVTL